MRYAPYERVQVLCRLRAPSHAIGEGVARCHEDVTRECL
jgi:hypothetical protein